jgi:hypothetical protein
MEKTYIIAYLAGAAWLLGWELSALAAGHPEWTISDFTWTLEGAGWSFARYFIAAALIWLTFHLSLGWFR